MDVYSGRGDRAGVGQMATLSHLRFRYINAMMIPNKATQASSTPTVIVLVTSGEEKNQIKTLYKARKIHNEQISSFYLYHKVSHI